MQFFFSRPMYFFMLNTNAYIYIHIHTRIYMYQYGVTDMSVDNSACAFVSHIIDSSQDERLKSNYLPERRRRTLRVPVNRRCQSSNPRCHRRQLEGREQLPAQKKIERTILLALIFSINTFL